MGYSRATRKQLIALDLIEGMVDAVRTANPSNIQVDQILRRISARQFELRKSLANLGERNQIIFDKDKDYRRYQVELNEVQDLVLSYWPGETLDGREYCNALLAHVQGMAKDSGRTREIWDELLGHLQELYETIDPGLTAEAQMDVGENIAEDLASTIEDI